MSVFAVQYFFVDDADLIQSIRPTHRNWLSGLLASGDLLASGPYVDFAGALLIFSANEIEQLQELLNQDPYELAGVIAERTITQWNPVFGPLNQN